MAEIGTQAWVTSALTNEDVPSAITLCYSLRRVLSTRKVGVLISPKLSLRMKKALYQIFSFVFCLEEDFNLAGLNDQNFAKIFTLTLIGFTKCVFLSPTMLVLKNCDALFEESDVSEKDWQVVDSLTNFMVQPSVEVFNSFMDSLQKVGDALNIDMFMRTWKNTENKPFKLLGPKYNHQICGETGVPNWNALIVNLNYIPCDQKLKTCGIFCKSIKSYRKLIVNEDVQPFLQSLDINSVLLKHLEEPRTFHEEPIAIIGMSCRFPDASNLEEFWNLLILGRDGITSPPDFRWTTNLLSTADARFRQTKAGFLNYPVEEFDAKFFNISPKEMLFLDPQQRLLHELVWEGLEDSGINPQTLRGTNGSVFLGAWTMDYKEILIETGISEQEYYRTYMGNSFGAAAARLSFFLGMTGPSIATESGCSSAMVALHLACKSLRQRETNLGLACGVNLLLHPFGEELIPMVLSASGACKTFDANADGFVRAEGGGVLVLKRVSDALRDGDNILALIRGSGISQEGSSKSMGTPTVHSEFLAMSLALKDAGVLPEQVSYVEAHGTGTPVGDPLEIEAIAKAYYSPNRKEHLLIGSVKTNVGHTESCSGITGIIKVVLAMENEVIPPHRNLEKLNPAIDLESIPAEIPLAPLPWKLASDGKPRLAGVSSFGITGTDAHVILEEPPPKILLAQMGEWERPLHLIKISAKTVEAVDIIIEKYKHQLTNNKENFKDFAYTANVGRADFGHRAILVASSAEEAVKLIENNSFRRGQPSSRERLGKICFLFTGQGSQYAGMAHQLYETSPVFRINFEYCAKILKQNYNIDIILALWGTKNYEINRTIYSQTSIFCVEIALLCLWESWGVEPDYVIGHSLGEFAAAVCAGILNVEDALKLVAERSKLIEALPPGKMLVVKASLDKVEKVMRNFAQPEQLDIAAINSDEQTVLAGSPELILEFSKFCIGSSLKCVVLEATHAFHSKHMDPMLDQYKKVASNLTQSNERKGRPVFISGLCGSVVEINEVDPSYWVRHTREKVQFLEASRKAVELGCKTFIEIGPQPVLSALIMLNSKQPLLCLPSLKRSEDEWTTLLSSLGLAWVNGLEIDWKGLDQHYKRNKIRLPHYPFHRKRFWPEVSKNGTPSLHPLLGSIIPNPSSTKLFQGALNTRSLDYLRDHVIGNNIIFPATAFLEMCLAAGLATIQGSTDSLSPPNLPTMIKDVIIEAPLSLPDSETRQITTIAELNAANEIKLEIFQKKKCAGTGWLRHATATFFPVITSTQNLNEIPFDAKEMAETLKLPASSEDISEMYERLGAAGLIFGPTFRSIEKVWRVSSDKAENALIAKVKAPRFRNQYIIHPVVLDAMIQSIVMAEHSLYKPKKLYVPVKVGELLWLSPVNLSEDIYIYAFSSVKERSCSALLLDGCGNHLAIMSSVELIETTARGIESFLEQQNISLPEMWEEVWKSQVIPTQFPMSKVSGKFFSDEFEQRMKIINENPEDIVLQTRGDLEQFAYFHILASLYELGWNPQEFEVFEEHSLVQNLRVKESIVLYVGFFLEVLEKEGMLHKLNINNEPSSLTWKVVKKFPSQEEVKEMLNSFYFSSLPSKLQVALLMRKLGQELSSVLRGEQNALAILFPTDADVGEFFSQYGELFRVAEIIAPVVNAWVSHVKQSVVDENSIFRVLEIGTKTDWLSSQILKALREKNVKFEYTYTDVSFIPGTEKRFGDYVEAVYKKLNIEEDPLSQGFTPEYYDAVVSSEVIHTTRNIKESLQNIRMLMKAHAPLGFIESTSYNRILTYLFGSLESFWKFEDRELRNRHCYLSKTSWSSVLEQNGFEVNGKFSMLNNSHSYFSAKKTSCQSFKIPTKKAWIVFTLDSHPVSEFLEEKLRHYRTVILVVDTLVGSYEQKDLGGNKIQVKLNKDKESDFKILLQSLQTKRFEIEGVVYCWALEKRSQNELLRPYFYLVKTILTKTIGRFPRFYAMTSGVAPLDENDMSNCYSATLWGFTRAMKNENFGVTCKCIENADDNWGKVRCREILYELWNNDKDVIVAFNGKARYVPRLRQYKPNNKELMMPKGLDRFQLILPETKSIADLQFGPLALGSELEENQVEIQIRATGLNFRDVLSVLKPTEKFEDINTVGLDFAGVVKRTGTNVTKWKVGNEVFGANANMSAMQSHIFLNEELITGLPKNWTFCDAATIPTVFLTSILCLVETAKIKKEDVVLVHTASGGVGLSAIQICKNVGCTVIATAGSKRKRNYLREILGLKHIFHSRNTLFLDEILKLTDGRGVDVVLNSLTGEGFKEATLKACGKGARFVEISKLNIWQPEQVAELRPDVEYTIVDLSSENEARTKRLMEQIIELQLLEIIKPIPYVRFDALNIREALQYLQKAKHIGKVVCVMPELRKEGSELKFYTPLFNNKSSYLITGGLGGIGLVVCRWMLEKGAKHIVLASRNLPNPSTQRVLNELNSVGANVISVELDVGNFEKCRELIENGLGDLPPLRGIMNAAGTLADALLVDLDWTQFSSTFNAKVNGTQNLHELTKQLELEHFVQFSSISALLGPPGQCNHSAGNMYEDAFTHYRHSLGLPATTINWGCWGEVGVATEIDVPGLKSLSNFHGVAGLEHVLKSGRTQTAIFNTSSFITTTKVFPQLAHYLDENIMGKNTPLLADVAIGTEQFWREYDSSQNLNDKIDAMKNLLRNVVRETLKHDQNEVIGDDADMQEMGVDSLMFVEIRNGLQTLFGSRFTVNASALKDCTTIALMSNKLVQLIEGMDTCQVSTIPTMEQVSALIRKDGELPLTIRATKDQNVGDVKDIQTVLLTGCTGTLGPYVLKELTDLPQIRQVVCLIRPQKVGTLKEKLTRALATKDIKIPTVDMEKISCVAGNVSEPRLGMEPSVWEDLSENVVAIFHCAASIQHTERYTTHESPNGSRAVNVDGTRNILEFAAEKRLKYVYHASSLLAVPTIDEKGTLDERWPEIGVYDNITTFAYPVTKFVGELLMKQGVERGIPCKVFRFPLIVGESKTGRCSIENNHLLLRYMFVMKNGIIPSNPLPMSMLPVDMCAEASVKIFFRDADSSGIYNICHRQPDTDQEFVEIAKRFGYHVDIVEYSEFLERVRNSGGESSYFSVFKEIYNDEIMELYTCLPALKMWVDEEKKFEKDSMSVSRKVKRLLPWFYGSQERTMEYIFRDLSFVKSQGWFEKFGLNDKKF